MPTQPINIHCHSKLDHKFEHLFEPELINELCACGVINKYDANKTIVDIGAPIPSIPLVVSGSIKVLSENKEGDELLLYYLELGDTCAVTLNCCSRSSKSSVRAVTETASEVLFIPVNKMEEWMVKFSSWRRYVLQSYNDRLQEMGGAIDNIVFHSLEDRLKKYLREKAFMGKSSELQISHQDIANDLFASRVAISRIMKKLEGAGYIHQGRNKIIVVEFQSPE